MGAPSGATSSLGLGDPSLQRAPTTEAAAGRTIRELPVNRLVRLIRTGVTGSTNRSAAAALRGGFAHASGHQNGLVYPGTGAGGSASVQSSTTSPSTISSTKRPSNHTA